MEATFVYGGIPFVYKVTLVSTCSRVVFGRQPDLSVDCPGPQGWDPLENAHIVGYRSGWIILRPNSVTSAYAKTLDMNVSRASWKALGLCTEHPCVCLT